MPGEVQKPLSLGTSHDTVPISPAFPLPQLPGLRDPISSAVRAGRWGLLPSGLRESESLLPPEPTQFRTDGALEAGGASEVDPARRRVRTRGAPSHPGGPRALWACRCVPLPRFPCVSVCACGIFCSSCAPQLFSFLGPHGQWQASQSGQGRYTCGATLALSSQTPQSAIHRLTPFFSGQRSGAQLPGFLSEFLSPTGD